jgi:AmmeMemoRadiSam system protein B/AmmeMemoRadiSam system protein A
MKLWKTENRNRKAAVAGNFYPGTKSELKKKLVALFESAKEKEEQILPLQSIISPHAGYMFSGEVAASAFNQIPEHANYKRVFVLASSHQFHFEGAAVYLQGNYETPLGEIKTDLKIAKQLISSSNIFRNKPEAHENEHSLEVQLPFLQYKLGTNFQLVPIILGTNQQNECQTIAEVLKPYFTSDNLFVISTDFSHYPTYDNAITTDKKTADIICTNQAEDLRVVLENNKKAGIKNLATSLCGWTSVLALLYLTEGGNFKFSQINYQNSGDAKIYGDKDRVVGYWAISVYGEALSFKITEAEKTEILNKARQSIKTYLETATKRNLLPPKSKTGILNDKTGVFVSIYVQDKLRGCIGGFAQDKTLNELVQKMSVSAAADKRFDSLKAEELDEMQLEISVLSPLKRIESIDEIELGKHGIFIQQNYNTGTFLPQVAKKTSWTVEQFLGHCSRDKVGIGWDGWKTAEISIYEAIVFSNK